MLLQLMNTSILRFAPQSFKNRINHRVEATYGATAGGLKNLTQAINKTMYESAALDLNCILTIHPVDDALW